jgi:hypothetical protein
LTNVSTLFIIPVNTGYSPDSIVLVYLVELFNKLIRFRKAEKETVSALCYKNKIRLWKLRKENQG